MYCDRCGAEIPAGASFCANCGAVVSSQPTEQYAPVSTGAPVPTPSSILTMGILAVAFCCTFYFSFLGIVFGAIGKSKAKSYLAYYGEPSGQVKAGSIMSKIGFIVGIVFTVLAVLAIIGMIASNA
ncbi:MAG: zinc ribbon domain-containing protein [Oscillospiraceae bacterium]|nr:zinc ribbon domain-containing protein [Oscillospiraceae bacterium]